MSATTQPQTVVTLRVTATIEVKFNSYGNEALNQRAKDQIAIWVEETLNDEEQIPLFVSTPSGEESISKTVNIEIENE
jgi:cobalamin biosynthesis protein CbiD